MGWKRLTVLILILLLPVILAAKRTGSKPARSLKKKTVPAVKTPARIPMQPPAPAPAVTPRDLLLQPQDIEIIPTGDGFDMYIRRKPALGSVLLSDSVKDFSYQNHSYGLRALRHNPVNGDEFRLLDGKIIENRSKGLYFLMSSRPVPHGKFGSAFHIYLPPQTVFGYPWARQGVMPVTNGGEIILRLFALPHADYRGPFIDQKYVISIRPPDRFPPGLVESFRELGETVMADTGFEKGVADLVHAGLRGKQGETVDIALVIDSTMSMREEIPLLKRNFGSIFSKIRDHFPRFRIALVLYRDYGERYLTKTYDFTTNETEIISRVSDIEFMGGMDIPEAVYEALDAAAHKLSWANPHRIIYLFGDAPPHPEPRGSVTRESVLRDLKQKKIQVFPLAIPTQEENLAFKKLD